MVCPLLLSLNFLRGCFKRCSFMLVSSSLFQLPSRVLVSTISPPDAADFVQDVKDEILPEVTLFLTTAAGIILVFAAFKSLAGKL